MMPTDSKELGAFAKEKLKPAETTHFQVIYTLHEMGTQMWREGQPTRDSEAAGKAARTLMARHDVKEVFICTIHAAYEKETTVKQVI